MQFYEGTIVHRRTAAAGISGAALHRAGHRCRVSEAARRQEVPAYGETCGSDHQRVPRGRLLRSRRRQHAGGRRRQDTSARQPCVGHAARTIHSALFDLRTFDADLETPFSLAARVPERQRHRLRQRHRSRRSAALEGRYRRRRHHRSAKGARHPDQDLSRVLGQAPGTSGLPRRGSTRSCTWLASRLSSSSVRTPRTRSTSSSRGSSPSSCRGSICSPILRR